MAKNNVKQDPELQASGNYHVSIPEERLAATDIRLDGKPFVCVLNEALPELKPKEPFRWFLSLVLYYEKTEGERMPDKEDTVKMQDFVDILNAGLKEDASHPNAVFLGRVTGDSETEAMWYINNPQTADEYLASVISSDNFPFKFDYVIRDDPEWEEAHYWLE